MGKTNDNSNLREYLTPIGAWALAFGCSVGWGSFVMPGTTFLPMAGPIGTVIGMIIGGLVMLLVGINYFYMMVHYPDCGSTYAYTKNTLGYDHGFISTWFLMLVYIAIVWANVTALPIIFRNLFGSLFQFGFHYTVAGYTVYLGEVLLSLLALGIACGVCIHGVKFSEIVQIVMAILLIGGIVFCAICIFSSGSQPLQNLKPYYAADTGRAGQIMRIVFLAPWAYVGFESITHSVEEYSFNVKKAFPIIVIALISGVIAYSLLVLIAASALPKEYSYWKYYIKDLENLSGVKGLPTFNAVKTYMGDKGLVILGIAAVCGIMTGLVGNLIAASRLVYSMAKDNMIGSRFTRINEQGVPANVIFVLVLISIPIPLFGRTAIGWIIDVNTVGATLAYVYTSWTAFKTARKENYLPVKVTGMVGFLISMTYTIYFLIPGVWSISKLATESYLILIVWSMLGFFAFRHVYMRDRKRRFGRSTVVWITLLFLVFFLSMLWFREATKKTTAEVLVNIDEYNETELSAHGVTLTLNEIIESEDYIAKQVERVNDSMQMNSILQMATILVALFIMFSIYNNMMHREKDLEVQKARAEENSKAKSDFLSNMSHDIRTPMNAIIGYTELAKDVDNMPDEGREYLDKIEASSKHLLALVNDILDMSRIENGKMELDIVKTDLKKCMDDIRDIFSTQMKLKRIDFVLDAENIKNRYVMCDANRLNRVMLNLISNAYKFTPEGGSVRVSLYQISEGASRAYYRISVKDSGMGMSPEFAEKVFEAYEREKDATDIQGTGLGMAITKNILDLMDGSITVETEKGKGTEFVIDISFPTVDASEMAENESDALHGRQIDYTKVRLLLVDDQPVNREIAIRILKKFGFQVDYAENGAEAVDKVKSSEAGYYQAILMDVQMPVMNGYEATRQIRALDDPEISGIPIVAMTANAFKEDVEAALDAGMDRHIAKPIDIGKLIETLNEILTVERASL
ncbi:ATP-binding response regulator [Butyrivibrio sp. VCD2006]|uniref:ATP-binding response regulator n=1 Tax=Butyrivibrio sp. VCD2006 TaxID=1280664 RepID=UPI00041E0A4F|nr:amino acid permease [Butyrivibrio sp. VCD2006]